MAARCALCNKEDQDPASCLECSALFCGDCIRLMSDVDTQHVLGCTCFEGSDFCDACNDNLDGVYMTVVKTCEGHYFPLEEDEDDCCAALREPKRKRDADHDSAAKRRKLDDRAEAKEPEAKDDPYELPSYEQSQAHALSSLYCAPPYEQSPPVDAPLPEYKKPCACCYQPRGMTHMGWQVRVVRPIGEMVVSYPYPGWQKDIQSWKELAEIVIIYASRPGPYWPWLDAMANIAQELLAALDSHCQQECAGLGFILALVTFLQTGPNEQRAEGGPALAPMLEAGPEVLPRAMPLHFEPLWPQHTTDYSGSAFAAIRA